MPPPSNRDASPLGYRPTLNDTSSPMRQSSPRRHESSIMMNYSQEQVDVPNSRRAAVSQLSKPTTNIQSGGDYMSAMTKP